MSLKVLLADDSAAIKKVVQLSLQDYGVELRSVSSGKDVLDVARHFVPDIAFIDVLLPHQTGYEVAAQMKKDATLKKTPIVMLWSAFMAFDEAKFKASSAEEKLEKPFEVNALRELVNRLVPKNQNNPLSMHLDFPKMEFDTPVGAVPPAKKPIMPVESPVKSPARPPLPQVVKGNPAPATPPAKEEWSMGSFDDIASFSANADASKGHDEIELDAEPTESSSAPVPHAEGTQLETDFFNFGGTANKTLTSFFGAKAQAAAAAVVGVETSAPSPAVGPAPSALPPAGAAWNSDNNEWVRKDLGKFKVPIPDENEDNTVSFQYENEIKNTNFLLKPEDKSDVAKSNVANSDASTGPPADHDAPPTEDKTEVFKNSNGAPNDRTQPVINRDLAAITPRVGTGPAANSQPAANVNSNSVPRPGHAHTQPQAAVRYEMTDKDIEKIREEVRGEMRTIIERVVWKLVPEIASQIIRDEITRLTSDQ